MGECLAATTKLVLAGGLSFLCAEDAGDAPSIGGDLQPGDLRIVRAGGSTDPVVVDKQTAALLRYFSTPSNLIDAVLGCSIDFNLDALLVLDSAFDALVALVASEILVPVQSTPVRRSPASLMAGAPGGGRRWRAYSYSNFYKKQFSRSECLEIVALNREHREVASRINHPSGSPLRNCSVFWIPRGDRTDWIFTRLWKLATTFNRNYGFELSPHVGAAQLTRYLPGGKYDWHMDLGAGDASLRKISLVVELSAQADRAGGGLEIFHGDAYEKRDEAEIGDVIVFPSFVMHRALPVERGVRWSLVIWLTGSRPLR